MNTPTSPRRGDGQEVGSADRQISIVLPAHNEVRLLGSTVTNLVTGLSQRDLTFEILIVENGSTDGTLRLARLLALQLPNVRVLTLPTGDYGAALRAGFEAARGEVIMNFDVDYYDLNFLDSSATSLAEGFELVLASKRALGARDRRPVVRRALTAMFTATLHYVLGLEVTDAHGMKAMRRDRLIPIVEQCTMNGSLFDVEMVLRALRGGLRVKEVPAVVIELRPPRTSIWWRAIESLVGLVRLRISIGQHRRQGLIQPSRRSDQTL